MALDTTLLDLDRVPAILEMRAFFKKHDWSAAKISEPKSRTTEEHTAISRIGRIMDAAFEQEARKRGLPAWSGYLDHTVYMNGEKYQDNPLITLRDSVEDLVSDAVRMLLTVPCADCKTCSSTGSNRRKEINRIIDLKQIAI